MYRNKNIHLLVALLLTSAQMMATQKDPAQSLTYSWNNYRKAVSLASGALGLGLIGLSFYDAKVNSEPLEWKKVAAGGGILAMARGFYPAKTSADSNNKPILLFDDQLRSLKDLRLQERLRDPLFRARKMSEEREKQLAKELAFIEDEEHSIMPLNNSELQQQTVNVVDGMADPSKVIVSLPFASPAKSAPHSSTLDASAAQKAAKKFPLIEAANQNAANVSAHSEKRSILGFMKEKHEEVLQEQVDDVLGLQWNVLPDGKVQLNFKAEKAQKFMQLQQHEKKIKADAKEQQDRLAQKKTSKESAPQLGATGLAPRKPYNRFAATLPAAFVMPLARAESTWKLRAEDEQRKDDHRDQLIQLMREIEDITINDKDSKIKSIVARVSALHATHLISVQPVVLALKTKSAQIGTYCTTELVDPGNRAKGRKNVFYRQWMQANLDNEFAVNAYKPFMPLACAGIMTAEDLIEICEMFGAQIDDAKHAAMIERINEAIKKNQAPK